MLVKFLVPFFLLAMSTMEPQRSLRFIGNSGFEISDESGTILIDFPYRSGAYGYMEFDSSEIHERSNSLCLFTHAHADHFNPEDLSRIGCKVAGPAEVLAKVSSALRLEGQSRWDFGDASILCIQSEHGDAEHCSYLLTWPETSVLVAGDVESVAPVVKQVEQMDILLLPYWLAGEVPQITERFPAVRVILSHRQPGENVEPCDGCFEFGQGDSIKF